MPATDPILAHIDAVLDALSTVERLAPSLSEFRRRLSNEQLILDGVLRREDLWPESPCLLEEARAGERDYQAALETLQRHRLALVSRCDRMGIWPNPLLLAPADPAAARLVLERLKALVSFPIGEDGMAAAESGQPTRKERRLRWMSEAMILIGEHPDWTDAAVAQFVGVNPSQLSRCRGYQRAKQIAQTREPPPKGQCDIDPDTGLRTVDAED